MLLLRHCVHRREAAALLELPAPPEASPEDCGHWTPAECAAWLAVRRRVSVAAAQQLLAHRIGPCELVQCGDALLRDEVGIRAKGDRLKILAAAEELRCALNPRSPARARRPPTGRAAPDSPPQSGGAGLRRSPLESLPRLAPQRAGKAPAPASPPGSPPWAPAADSGAAVLLQRRGSPQRAAAAAAPRPAAGAASRAAPSAAAPPAASAGRPPVPPRPGAAPAAGPARAEPSGDDALELLRPLLRELLGYHSELSGEEFCELPHPARRERLLQITVRLRSLSVACDRLPPAAAEILSTELAKAREMVGVAAEMMSREVELMELQAQREALQLRRAQLERQQQAPPPQQQQQQQQHRPGSPHQSASPQESPRVSSSPRSPSASPPAAAPAAAAGAASPWGSPPRGAGAAGQRALSPLSSMSRSEHEEGGVQWMRIIAAAVDRLEHGDEAPTCFELETMLWALGEVTEGMLVHDSAPSGRAPLRHAPPLLRGGQWSLVGDARARLQVGSPRRPGGGQRSALAAQLPAPCPATAGELRCVTFCGTGAPSECAAAALLAHVLEDRFGWVVDAVPCNRENLTACLEEMREEASWRSSPGAASDGPLRALVVYCCHDDCATADRLPLGPGPEHFSLKWLADRLPQGSAALCDLPGELSLVAPPPQGQGAPCAASLVLGADAEAAVAPRWEWFCGTASWLPAVAELLRAHAQEATAAQASLLAVLRQLQVYYGGGDGQAEEWVLPAPVACALGSFSFLREADDPAAQSGDESAPSPHGPTPAFPPAERTPSPAGSPGRGSEVANAQGRAGYVASQVRRFDPGSSAGC
eukprot:TRINITY_DN12840_c0_g1_i2.p1 TRINITY_DN12840_c0_g1~~TRINITY_DN12840_c0_g1_i2.p1  ORF type:complete len:864 (+),score=218.29 TRINITY_DN12840_c0_g1_i2:130-2592(+)